MVMSGSERNIQYLRIDIVSKTSILVQNGPESLVVEALCSVLRALRGSDPLAGFRRGIGRGRDGD